MGSGAIGLADAFDRLKPMLVGCSGLGISVALTPLILRTPITHISGGENIEGSSD